MKTLSTLFTAILITVSLNAQMNEQRAIKESHIDFTKEYIFFTLHGLIEIDGHIFINDTCKNPIQYQANLDGIAIVDTLNKIEYVHRTCDKSDCNIIHLKALLIKYNEIKCPIKGIPNFYVPNFKVQL